MAFSEHPDYAVKRLPDAGRSAMKARRQKIRRVRRRAIAYNPLREEEMLWLRIR